MGKYDIQDAYKLKVFMQEIQTIVDKYPHGAGGYIEDVPDQIKQAIEFIIDMVKAEQPTNQGDNQTKLFSPQDNSH